MSQEDVEIVRLGFERLLATGELPWDLLMRGSRSMTTTRPTRALIGGMRALRAGLRIGERRGLNGAWSRRSSSMPATRSWP